MSELHTLYAISHSLYSGRARSYLINNGIAFRELSTGHESFKADILPKGKLPTIPTLLTPGGEVIRDGAAIIEHFEAQSGRPCQPRTARQQIVSALFDVIGTDGLLRPAMHYRWNYPEENLDFVRYHFFHSQRDLPAREEKTEKMMDRMRHAVGIFGVTDETIELVEALYLEYLSALNAHLETVPYLLGWKPCIGDFGLLAPMYAHLGRDPAPLRIMQQQAVRVHRWVERMNRADQDAPEFFNAGTDFLPDDEIPETLLEILRHFAIDFVPETKAACEVVNEWIDSQSVLVSGTKVERFLDGLATFDIEGKRMSSIVMPFRFYLLKRLQHEVATSSASVGQEVIQMLASANMEELLNMTLTRGIVRAHNLEVWQ